MTTKEELAVYIYKQKINNNENIYYFCKDIVRGNSKIFLQSSDYEDIIEYITKHILNKAFNEHKCIRLLFEIPPKEKGINISSRTVAVCENVTLEERQQLEDKLFAKIATIKKKGGKK